MTAQEFYSKLDIPSGTIMTVYTVTIIVLSVLSFTFKRPIDTSVVAAYGAVAGFFAASKTVKAINGVTA